MNRLILIAITATLIAASPALAGPLDILKGLPGTGTKGGELLKDLGSAKGTSLSEEKIISGLKEALKVGTEKTVNLTGVTDGFFKNEAIKVLMPEKMKTVEKGLRALGFDAQVDEFILSMNRAAESAAPKAKEIFWGAIKEMSFDDARKIYGGGDTAATEYFREKTSGKLKEAFKPMVDKSLNEVGVTRQYKELMGMAKTIPFLKTEDYDVDNYVLDKSLNGLFHILAEQEKQIRTDPTARVTDLLKEVFGL
ncbi:MAG: DUF4197 domain-containing protein [Nitrospirota bacterium]|nr:DUF4197 domain-containing protein [Nitrospirota bacterium]